MRSTRTQRGFFQIKSHRKEASKPIVRGRRHRKNELLERFSAKSTDGPWRKSKKRVKIGCFSHFRQCLISRPKLTQPTHLPPCFQRLGACPEVSGRSVGCKYGHSGESDREISAISTSLPTEVQVSPTNHSIKSLSSTNLSFHLLNAMGIAARSFN